MDKAFRIRWVPATKGRLNSKGEWQLRFRDKVAYDFANTRLNTNLWLGITSPDDDEKLWTFTDENAGLLDVLNNLMAAGIPKNDIDVPKSCHGTEEQQTMLAHKNYQQATDRTGDMYYHQLWLPLIWLFTDGSWKCEKGSTHATLKEHLEHIADY
jgi:hypothetical protein